MTKSRKCGTDSVTSITWERAQAICEFAKPPKMVWQTQFDGFDDELVRMSQTPQQAISPDDLWYYHHDLCYQELQPDLFAYLFPVCLMDWHQTLQENQDCSHGDSEFHRSLQHGGVLERMLSQDQRAAVYEFFKDSFLERLDTERGFVYCGTNTPAYGWMRRFNSLGFVLPEIAAIWEPWWQMETPGRAVAALQYCSGLMYLERDNPLFGEYTRENGGGGPYLWESDSHIFDNGWLPDNVKFLQTTLKTDFVCGNVARAVTRLQAEPEAAKARLLLDDLPLCLDVIAERVCELPRFLESSGSHVLQWTV